MSTPNQSSEKESFSERLASSDLRLPSLTPTITTGLLSMGSSTSKFLISLVVMLPFRLPCSIRLIDGGGRSNDYSRISGSSGSWLPGFCTLLGGGFTTMLGVFLIIDDPLSSKSKLGSLFFELFDLFLDSNSLKAEPLWLISRLLSS